MKPQTFALDKNNVLFFNIFLKNKKLYLICPIHKNYNINKSTIKISYNTIELGFLEQITKSQYEPIQILMYKFNYPLNKQYNIDVSYNGQNEIYNLKHIETEKTKKLALTTLFKTDYKLNKIFYNYYKNHGVEHFYMYYNGIITNEIKSYYNKQDITLIEWDYVYWNIDTSYSRHYAQLGQIHDAIYRFGKDNYEYMLFCDLDEYLYLPKNNKLINLINDTSIDTFRFKNVWANTYNSGLFPDKFPNSFYISKNVDIIRSKCIHKMDNVIHIGIHLGSLFKLNCLKINSNLIMFHFHNWGKERKTIKSTPSIFTI